MPYKKHKTFKKRYNHVKRKYKFWRWKKKNKSYVNEYTNSDWLFGAKTNKEYKRREKDLTGFAYRHRYDKHVGMGAVAQEKRNRQAWMSPWQKFWDNLFY